MGNNWSLREVNMDDKYKLACVGVVSLVAYGSVALYTGHNGSITTAIISGVVGVIAGTIGFVWGKVS